jgi:GWxTD domain-containing protein
VHTKTVRFLLITILTLFFTADLLAQRRVGYAELSARYRNPLLYVDQNILPPAQGDMPTVVLGYRVAYEHLSFRKRDDDSYFSNITIGVEIFEGEPRRRGRELSAEGLEPVKRSFWRNTAIAENYEETKKPTRFATGFTHMNLEPGVYTYRLTLEIDGSRRNLGNTVRRIRVPDFTSPEQAQIYYMDVTEATDLPLDTGIDLIGMGQAVYYATDFTALVYLPDNDPYRLVVDRMEIGSRDTSRVRTVFETEISRDNTTGNLVAGVSPDSSRLAFTITRVGEGHRFAWIHIPNSTFPNATYRVRVMNDEGKSTGERFFRNLWLDMPVSLLNLDLAIDMMRFIIDRDQLREMRRGSAAEKERKFREFWDNRNPTPETEYNELMTEFYRRIDHAFQNFSSPTTPGYDSDQGRIFITHGEPLRITRTFPVNEPAREVWEYAGQSFIFVARTGFGDFELVGRQ